MIIDDNELFARMEEVQKAYEATLTLSNLAAVTAARAMMVDAPRNISYPIGFSMDEAAAHALVG